MGILVASGSMARFTGPLWGEIRIMNVSGLNCHYFRMQIKEFTIVVANGILLVPSSNLCGS